MRLRLSIAALRSHVAALDLPLRLPRLTFRYLCRRHVVFADAAELSLSVLRAGALRVVAHCTSSPLILAAISSATTRNWLGE
jgi:hypothetical protein